MFSSPEWTLSQRKVARPNCDPCCAPFSFGFCQTSRNAQMGSWIAVKMAYPPRKYCTASDHRVVPPSSVPIELQMARYCSRRKPEGRCRRAINAWPSLVSRTSASDTKGVRKSNMKTGSFLRPGDHSSLLVTAR